MQRKPPGKVSGCQREAGFLTLAYSRCMSAGRSNQTSQGRWSRLILILSKRPQALHELSIKVLTGLNEVYELWKNPETGVSIHVICSVLKLEAKVLDSAIEEFCPVTIIKRFHDLGLFFKSDKIVYNLETWDGPCGSGSG